MAKLLDTILVIDLESTCWDGPPPEGQLSEIIEIGLCTVDVRRLERTSKQSLLIKPERSTVSEFCTHLTTLTAGQLSNAGSFQDAVRLLRKQHLSRDRLWASWGDYDRRQMERQCRDSGVAYPFGPSHLNVKSFFAIALGEEHELGMDSACDRLGVALEGTHHRGIDDAWNIAGILCWLLGCVRNTGKR